MRQSELEGIYRKAELIAGQLRDRIVEGSYAAGSRLPTRDELAAHYGVSKHTVQRAFDQLTAEGFVQTVSRQGAFVATDSPHLTRYALLLPHKLGDNHHNQFFAALAQEAGRYSRQARFAVHDNFEGHEGMARYQGLMDDVRSRRLAGLLFASPPFALHGSPLLEAPNIPRALLVAQHQRIWSLPAVAFDADALTRMMLAEVLASGRRRVALIAPPVWNYSLVRDFQQSLRAAGLPVEPAWYQATVPYARHWTDPLIQLLMRGPATQRPDCLVVYDDNLLPAVSAALRDLGLSSPQDLHLVAHCNFPWPTPSALPVVRIGYRMGDLLQALMLQIDRQRAGQPTPPVLISPCHEADFRQPLQPPCILDGKSSGDLV